MNRLRKNLNPIRQSKPGSDNNTLQKILLFLMLVCVIGYVFVNYNEQQQPQQAQITNDVSAQPGNKPKVNEQTAQSDNAALKPQLTNLQMKYVNGAGNSQAMLISGLVRNPLNRTMAKIKIEASLLQDDKVIRNMETYIGRIVTTANLSQWSMREINSYLNSPYAANAVNNADNSLIMLKPGETMPFMVVFSNVQDQRREYKLEVLDWKLIN